jgi:hypothetical protein
MDGVLHLHPRSRSLYAFDPIALNGDDLRREPLTVRKHMEHDEGETVFRSACRLGLEGIVWKRRDARVLSRRSPDWVKMKKLSLARSPLGLKKHWGTGRVRALPDVIVASRGPRVLKHQSHRLRYVAEAVALLGEMTDAGPRQMVDERRHALGCEHVHDLNARLDALLGTWLRVGGCPGPAAFSEQYIYCGFDISPAPPRGRHCDCPHRHGPDGRLLGLRSFRPVWTSGSHSKCLAGYWRRVPRCGRRAHSPLTSSAPVPLIIPILLRLALVPGRRPAFR